MWTPPPYHGMCVSGNSQGILQDNPDSWKKRAWCRENRENAAKAVGETVQFFITTMDSLKLNMVAVDQLYPLLNDLMQFLNKVRNSSAPDS